MTMEFSGGLWSTFVGARTEMVQGSIAMIIRTPITVGAAILPCYYGD
jgi:hypothetical protein